MRLCPWIGLALLAQAFQLLAGRKDFHIQEIVADQRHHLVGEEPAVDDVQQPPGVGAGASALRRAFAPLAQDLEGPLGIPYTP